MSSSFIFYCPVCGYPQFQFNLNCTHCKNKITVVKSRHESEYYSNKSYELYNDYSHGNDILIAEEVSKNPLYNPRMRESQAPKEVHDKILQDIISKNKAGSTNIPKCPTCQSTNIKKISSAKRSLHAFAFGVFNKTAQSQFECGNCGYKW